ncbi:hypothetical protein EMPG_09888 [Blastomyces silverae]|uniref:Uncharacterized protein n=1 Tax=Blastomyces silverae TaxID=2060906 RepID=A0A0H1BGL4_9EURO|nr:hypothetical protein EMPG_09888 [Blastomyces silverae]
MPDGINLRRPPIYGEILHYSPSYGQAFHKFHHLTWTFYRFILPVRVRKGKISRLGEADIDIPLLTPVQPRQEG